MNDVLSVILEPLNYPFMARALLATLATATVCAVLSCWLVLTGWSLMGDAVSHAVLPGVVLSYALGLPFAVGAVVFGLLTVWLIGGVNRTTRIKEDASIGIVFTTLFALGLVMVSMTPSPVNLDHIIFGNLLGVSPGDLIQVAVLSAVCLTVLLLKRRDLTLYAFDPRHAHVLGLRPRVLGGILLGALAVTCVVALQAVGVVLVVAMLIIPGATALLLTNRFATMLMVAVGLSLFCSVCGVYASYYVGTSTGGTVVLCQGLMFCAVWTITRMRRILAGRFERLSMG
ncbi:metal ABC transporter permease [Kocuria massiliensis]|uniref:metal ABC transporter permease n=1 Tax=Kocuria massiliensis TaxID=1926282 RepID=UPI000A1CE6AF|nr:metal ABC transporter permease [Kocuria massiliensis]